MHIHNMSRWDCPFFAREPDSGQQLPNEESLYTFAKFQGHAKATGLKKSVIIFSLYKWSFYLVAFTLPLLQPQWNSLFIILMIILWPFAIGGNNIWQEIKTNRTIWLFSSLFLADAIGLIHSGNIPYGLRYVETHLSILVFPALILTSRNQLGKKVIDKIFYSLMLGIFGVLAGYLVIISTSPQIEGMSLGQIFQQRLTDFPPIRDQSIIEIHPSFLSMYISISIFFVINKFIHDKKSISVYLFSFLLILLLGFQVWLNSRAGLLGFLIVGSILLVLQLNRKFKLYTVAGLVVLLIIIFSFPPTKERFVDAPLRAWTNGTGVNVNDKETWPISFRIQIMDCSLSLLQDANWIFGYGTGDFKDEMYRCFVEKNYTWLMARNLDEHCEYFAQLHRLGILGLLLLLTVFLYPTSKALRDKNYLYFSFLILIAISAIPENLLASQKGVVFYALFNSLLFLGPKEKHISEEK